MQSGRRLGVPFFFLSTLIACSAGPIVVREAANSSGNDAPNTAPVALHAGDTFQADKTLSTGPGGRIQLDYESGLVRAGARSSLRLQKNGQLELRDGAFLFQNISANQYLTVATPIREVRISGDTGFVRVEHGRGVRETVVAVGALAGEVQVHNGAKSYKLGPADLLIVPAAGAIARDQFDLQKQMSSSRLITGFNSRLRDLTVLVSAELNFVSLRQRGFFRSHDLLTEQRGARLIAGSSLLGDTRERHTAGPASILPPPSPAPPAAVSFTPVRGVSTFGDSDTVIERQSPTPLQPPGPPPTYSGFRQVLPGQTQPPPPRPPPGPPVGHP